MLRSVLSTPPRPIRRHLATCSEWKSLGNENTISVAAAIPGSLVIAGAKCKSSQQSADLLRAELFAPRVVDEIKSQKVALLNKAPRFPIQQPLSVEEVRVIA